MPYIMKSNLISNFLSHLLIIICCILCSCTDESKTENGQAIPEGYSRVVLRLPSATMASRATAPGTPAEDAVSRADLFAFKDNLLKAKILNAPISSVDGKPTISVLLESSGNHNLYIITNAEFQKSLNGLTTQSTTEAEFTTLLTDTLTQLPSAPFIMSAKQMDVDIQTGEQVTIDLVPERLVCRFDITSSDPKLKISSIAFANAPAQTGYYGIAPGVEIPTFATKEIPTTEENKNILIYSYPYAPGQSNSEEKVPLSIIIKGVMDGTPLKYTLGLLSSTGDALEFKRNYIYTVKVSQKEAAGSVLDASISVKPWNISEDTIHITLPTDSEIKFQGYTSTANTSTYIESDSLFETAARGDELSLTFTGSGDTAMEISSDAPWITLTPAQNRKELQTYVLNISPNDTQNKRQGTVTLKNGNNSARYTISQFDPASDRYMVFVVAGQSNARGYDESPKHTGPGETDAPTPGVYQLGLNGADNLKVIPLEAFTQDMESMERITDATGKKGVKSIHLPLAQLMLKQAPAGYNILAIPVAYGGSGFHSSLATSTYNKQLMKPDQLSRKTRWGKGQAYYHTMIDRVKFTLNANPDNKFIGVIWCQGEEDMKDACNLHYTAFSNMTEGFFNEINSSGLGQRCPRARAGKHLWYNFSTTPYWYDILPNPQTESGQAPNAFRGAALFGAYKVWNPDTFVHIPENYNYTNWINGTGSTMKQRGAHFGNNSYRNVVAPMVMECITENQGMSFNGNIQEGHARYTNNMSYPDALAKTGSLNELRSGLMVYLPMDGQTPISTNMSPSASAYNINLKEDNIKLADVDDFPATDGNTRNRKTLELDSWNSGKIDITIPDKTATSWTLSFMLKRKNGEPNKSILRGRGGMNNKLFVGFKQYMGEACGGYSELAIEPSYTGQTGHCGTARLLYADKVRSHSEWIHYSATYEATSKRLTIYMNGQNVFKKIITAANSDISQLVLGGDYSNGMLSADAYLAELYIWERALNTEEIQKNYIMSYFGVKK